MIRMRYLGRLRYRSPREPENAHALILLKNPSMTVVQQSCINDDRPERRMVGFVIEQHGIQIRVDDIRARELATDLEVAYLWQTEG